MTNEELDAIQRANDVVLVYAARQMAYAWYLMVSATVLGLVAVAVIVWASVSLL